MEDSTLVENFVSLTNADRDVAKHYLEACNWELESALNEYLENAHEPQDNHTVPISGTSYPLTDVPIDEEQIQRRTSVDGDEDMEVDSQRSFHTPVDTVSPEPYEPSFVPRNIAGRFGYQFWKGSVLGTGIRHEILDLPEGFNRRDLFEAQMLEAALTGAEFQGDLSEIMPSIEPRLPPRPPSPKTLADRELIRQQDLEYEETKRRDQEKKREAVAKARQEREASVLEEARKRQEEESLQRLIRRKKKVVSAEPDENHPEAIVVQFRLPDGTRFRRRFLKTDPVCLLFDFVDVEINASETEMKHDGKSEQGWWKLNGYNLVTQFPRRIMKSEDEHSLEAAGLTDRQESLFVEIK